MERIPPETKAIYDLLRADFDKALAKSDREHVDSTAQTLSKLDAKLDQLSSRIDEVKISLGVDIDELRQGLDRSPLQPPEASRGAPSTPQRQPDGGPIGPDGHRGDTENRGQGHKVYVPPPVRGMQLDQNPQRIPFSSLENSRQISTDVYGLGPRIEMPRFDGTNPKLWQTQCEDYFRFWSTPQSQWISLATSLFEGSAARWLDSVRRRVPNVTWEEFCHLLQNRFGRNLHQSILRKFFHISQMGTVEEYVEQFSDLFDQLAAYENSPNSVHYVTRFMEGLKPSIKLAVGIQQPTDLDTAYQLALLHEELGMGSGGSVIAASSRRATAFPLPPPPVLSSSSSSTNRASDEKRNTDPLRKPGTDDKWGALRAYRRAKGLCYVCGERWSKDHVCKQEVQLHIVQEMIEILQSSESDDCEVGEQQLGVHMISISAAAVGDKSEPPVRTMQLRVQLQGHNVTFLVDSGSTHSFVDLSLAAKLSGVTPMARVMVKIANGDAIPCQKQLQNCSWSCSGHKFLNDFKLFPLGSYDGILG